MPGKRLTGETAGGSSTSASRMIFAWAKAYLRRTGCWPTARSGAVLDTDGLHWETIDGVLRRGSRGLPGGSSLSKLLRARGAFGAVRHRRPLLTEPQILDWAEAFFKTHGHWPRVKSGSIPGAPGNTWKNINYVLRAGLRGLPGGQTLARLLFAAKGVPAYERWGPPLTERQILAWADDYHRRNGSWPNSLSGPVAPGESQTWDRVYRALKQGKRGLDGNSSLALLLERSRGVPPRGSPLSESQIFAWARAHFRRTGSWPNAYSGPVLDANGEDWNLINAAAARRPSRAAGRFIGCPVPRRARRQTGQAARAAIAYATANPRLGRRLFPDARPLAASPIRAH